MVGEGAELSREYSTRTKADRKIVAGFRELRDKPKAVKRAFRDALNIEPWDKTRFRKVGEDDFLYEPETLQVFGDLTICQQYELAKAPLDVKRSIREHFRTHREDNPSKDTLKEMRLAAKPQPEPVAGDPTKQTPEAVCATNQTPEAVSVIEDEIALVENPGRRRHIVRHNGGI